MKLKETFFFIFISLLLCGCSNPKYSITDFNVVRVSIIFPEINDAYWSEIQKGMDKEIAQLGENIHADYKIMTPTVAYNEDLMIELVRQQIAAKVDVLVIPGMRNRELIRDLENAMDSGTKVICIDADMEELRDHIYIGTDNIMAGRMLAQQAIEISNGEAIITVVLGERNNLNQESRLQGFQDEISKVPSMEIRNIEYDQYDGSTFLNILNANQKSDMIICLEGTGAKVLGTVRLGEDKSYRYILGFDHTDGLFNGMVDGVIVQDIDDMGKTVVDIIEEYALTGQWKANNHYTKIEFVKNKETSGKDDESKNAFT